MGKHACQNGNEQMYVMWLSANNTRMALLTHEQYLG
jgi:hypothetical protein